MEEGDDFPPEEELLKRLFLEFLIASVEELLMFESGPLEL